MSPHLKCLNGGEHFPRIQIILSAIPAAIILILRTFSPKHFPSISNWYSLLFCCAVKAYQQPHFWIILKSDLILGSPHLMWRQSVMDWSILNN